MCEILYTSLITFFTIIYTTFIIQIILEEKKLILKWSSIICLFSSYNPVEPRDFLRAYGHAELCGSDWKGLKDLYCISPHLGDCRWGPCSC